FIKICLYGDYGSGKTFALADLAEKHGLKMVVLTTDIGGDGLSTVVAELKDRGRLDLIDTNFIHVTLESYDQVSEFIDKPELYIPEIYDFDPDMIVWDGFSNFQKLYVSDAVESDPEVIDRNGDIITLKYWGKIQSVSTKTLHRFLTKHNPKTGKV